MKAEDGEAKPSEWRARFQWFSSCRLRRIRLSAPHCGLTRTHAKRAWPRTCWRLARSVEQVLEHNGVVALLVFRGVQECETFSFVGQGVKLLQVFFGFWTGQFLQITLAKNQPLVRLSVKPLTEFVGGSKVAKPLVHGDLRLSETAGPQTIDENARSIGARCRFVNPLHRDRHGFRLSSIIVSPAGLPRLWETEHN